MAMASYPGTKVERKSDGRTGVSTMNRDGDGEIKIKFDSDGSESGYINTSDVCMLGAARKPPGVAGGPGRG